MKRYSTFSTLFFSCLSFFILSHSHSLNNGFTVELIHRDSPKSPLYNPKETKFQRLTNAIHRSINYANYFNKVSQTDQTPITTVIPNRGEYLMEYSVGTPPFKVFGIADTGSDIVWLQCKPCENCYNQTSPIFDPSKSSTYRTLPCNSNACQSLENTQCSSNCEYNIQYGDGSVSHGDLSVDTLSLDSTNGGRVSFPKTIIGCGHENTVSFQGQSSGIVGLGGGPVSFTTQLSSPIAGKFSYCLVPLLSDTNVTSSLNFGDSALVSGEGAVSTPLVQPQGSTTSSIFYYLTLEGFSVGNEKIEFGSDGGFSKGNIVIDSGTTLTLLPDDLLSRLESAVAKVVNNERVQDPSQQLSLCYNQENLRVPVITAHFSGADVVLNSLNTFIPVAEEIVCFAFATAPSAQLGSIFGNVAQQNFLVGYDLQNNAVSFKPTDCTKQ